MSCRNETSRLIVKRSKVTGERATVPPNEDHRSGLWSATDIYKGELFYNQVDGVLQTRGDDGVGTVAIEEKTFGNTVIVSEKSDFPEPTAGIILLEANKTYFIYGDIDLTGDRIVTQGTNAIIGSSSETSSLTSTGIGADELINSDYTLVMQNITIKDVALALVIDGIGNNVALDWVAVNFLNVTEIGTIKDVRNFIYTSGAFLSSQGLKFNGTIGTISFFGSLFIGDATTADDIIEVLSTTIINRRFRIIYSTVSTNLLKKGINVSASATIPNEGFILDTVNFEGTGTYLTGLDHTSNKASFKACTGIVNSDEIAQYFMNGNTTATTITTVGTAVKVAGTTTAALFNQKFDHSDNRATYLGSRTRFFKVTATLSVQSGNNNEIGIYIAKNDTLLSESEIYITTNSGGRAENGMVQTIVELSQDDYIEIFVENDTSTTDVTVTDLNVIID